MTWKDERPESRQARITRNRAYVAARREETVCARCGAQPIDWHGEHHHAQPKRRLFEMANHDYALQTIADEIARCTPLCRRCHMAEDGRMQRFVEAGMGWRSVPKAVQPCQQCQRLYKPLRHNLCARCYERQYRPGRKWGKTKRARVVAASAGGCEDDESRTVPGGASAVAGA